MNTIVKLTPVQMLAELTTLGEVTYDKELRGCAGNERVLKFYCLVGTTIGRGSTLDAAIEDAYNNRPIITKELSQNETAP